MSLETMISEAQARQAERQAIREQAAIEEWNRRVKEWCATYRQHASETFGADFMQQLAPKLAIGREKHYQIRGIVTYAGKTFELTEDGEGWFWTRVDDDTAPEWNIGPHTALRQLHQHSLEECQDLLLCALAELVNEEPLLPLEDE